MLGSVKTAARRIFPAIATRRARELWEYVRDWVDLVGFQLWFVSRRLPSPKLLLFFGFAPGDDLLSTAVLRELRLRGRDRLLMVSNHMDLFVNNQDPTYVRSLWHRYSEYDSTVRICRRFARLRHAEFKQPEYAPLSGDDRRRVPPRHVVAEMCARAGIVGPVSVKPYLVLSEEEKAAASWARDRIVVQSSGLAARHPARNKEWFAERFQAVVDALSEDFDWVQVGSTLDPALRQTLDLRGSTSVREAAAILHHARIFVGLEGFLMHLARAVDCPSVIIFGGRTAPSQLGYICNFNIYSDVPCAPCWRTSDCDFNRKCMSDISVDDVISAIHEMLQRPRDPLAVETIDISIPGTPRESELHLRQIE